MGLNSSKNITNMLEQASETINTTIEKNNSTTATIDIEIDQTIVIQVDEDAKLECGGDLNLTQTASTNTKLINGSKVNSNVDLKNSLSSALQAALNQSATSGPFGIGDSSENNANITQQINQIIQTTDVVNNIVSSLIASKDDQSVTIRIKKGAALLIGKNCNILQSDIKKAQVYQTMSAILDTKMEDSEVATALAKVSQTASAGTLSGSSGSGTLNVAPLISLLVGMSVFATIITFLGVVARFALGSKSSTNILNGVGGGTAGLKKI